MTRTLLCVMAVVVIGATLARAQDSGDESSTEPTPAELKEQIDGANERLTTVEGDVSKLKATKVGGYLQAEWQHFDQSTSVGGRAFYSDARKNFFWIRRGRIKVSHKFEELMSVTFETDFTERGVSVKDAFGTVNLLPDDELSLNVGLFNRPHYETEVSSSVRESPEHAQVTQAFYPTERDLGLMLTTRETLFENFDPKLQVGIFNGPGVASEVDPYKDIITRLTFPLPLGGESPVQVDLGASYYYGGIPQTGAKIIKTVDGKNQIVDNDATGDLAGMGNRSNFNVESQIYLDVLPFGGTIIKGEFLTGKRPTAPTSGTAASVGVGKDSAGNEIPVVKPATSGNPLQIRNQSGYYAYFVQNIGAQWQLALKYDYFDRNTDLTGAQVTSLNDVASAILGFGVNFFYNNIRVTAWYEIPSFAADENVQRDASGAVINSNDVKDNKTTLRFQYKF